GRDAFRQRLPHDTSAARTDRRADGHFLLPRGTPREEKIGYVRAGDEKYQSDGAEQCEKGWFHLPNQTFVERPKRNVPALVRLVKLLVEPRVDAAHASLRLLQIDVWFETGYRRPRAVIARLF